MARPDLTAWPLLTGLAWRRERRFAIITFVVFVAMNAATAVSIRANYSTPEQIASLRIGAGPNAAFKFLLGPLPDTNTEAALTVWRAGLFLVAALAVCTAIVAIRQTRKEEELGRTELLRAGAVGRHAPLVAATIVAVGLAVAVALGMSLMLFGFGAGIVDVAAVFAQYAGAGIAAAAVGLIVAQVATTSHIANLAASSVVLLGYLLRGVADASGDLGWLRWLTPIGWAELIRPFDVNSFWPLLASMAMFGAGVVIAGWLLSARDLGGGLIEPRPGPAAGRGFSTIEMLAAQLSLPVLISWAGGIAVYAFIVGCLQPSVDDLADGNEQVADFLRNSGAAGSLSAVFAVTMMGLLAAVATAWSATVVTRLHADETSGRTESVLATPTSRGRYFLSHFVVALVGVVVVVCAAAVAIVVGNAVAGGDVGQAAHDVFLSGAAQLAACVSVCAAVLACFAVSARLAQAGWAIVVLAVVLGPLGALFGLPQSIRDISPFSHATSVPLQPMNWGAYTTTLVVTVVLGVCGWWGFRRRDIG